jgi:hypothetical protein
MAGYPTISDQISQRAKEQKNEEDEQTKDKWKSENTDEPA